MEKIEPRVYILDDDLEWCESLKWLLGSVNLQTVIYNDVESYLKAYQLQWRGCLLLDIRMPGMSGLQLQEKLNASGNQMPIIVISGHADVPLTVRAMKAGAFDLITKPVNEQQLLEQIYRALEQDRLRQKQAMSQNEFQRRCQTLTEREREVMLQVMAGKLNKQIAAELRISIKTVEVHRSHLMHKLKIRTVAELFKLQALA